MATDTTAPTSSRDVTIELTAQEQQLRDLLVDVASYVDESKARKEQAPLVLRWAGGWVRDRLLGGASEDIDTAIDTMTGYAFAEQMKEFCGDAAKAARHGLGAQDMGSLHRVAANPDKSKHLETATVRILGKEVDFVNLRRETYTADSRNPQVEFGTPLEDALRRDATVNALFYNLHSGRVEDLTGGLADMDARLIRTPLEPLQTFADDPLRVLRLVRFASRLQFAIDPAAEAVMADPTVLRALRRKISRERVGTEIEKMLRGRHPRDALTLVDRLGLYHAIFTPDVEGDRETQKPDLAGWTATYACLADMVAVAAPASVYDVLVRTEEARYFAWVLAAIVPWERVPGDAEGKKLPPAAIALRDGIRAPNKLCDVVAAAHRHRPHILALKQLVIDRSPLAHERDRFGMAIRAWDARGSNWKLQVLYALLYEILEAPQNTTRLLTEWQAFVDHLATLDVLDAPHTKRLLDGKQVAAALGIRPGKWMGAAMDICMAWQLRHPGETDAAGAIEEVRQRGAELGIEKELKK